MAQAGLTLPERTAVNAFSPISSKNESSTQTHAQQSIEMTITRSPSPSQPRVSWRSVAQNDHMSSPAVPIEDSSRDSSQTRNYTHTPFEDLRTRDSIGAADNHSDIDERYLDVLHLDDTPTERDASPDLPEELCQAITPTTTIASASDKSMLSNHSTSDHPYSSEKSNEEQVTDRSPKSPMRPNCDIETNSRQETLDNRNSISEFQSDNDYDMDDVEWDSGSDEEYFEERWVSMDEALEASVIRSTGYNLELAARLIPQLYEMFENEKSSVIGFWETCYRQRVGYEQGSGLGGAGHSSGSYPGQDKSTRKKQRENDEKDWNSYHKNQGGDGDGNRESTKDKEAEVTRTLHFACPFNLKHPEIYNCFYNSPEGRGEYKICETGWASDQRFREHLERKHRCVQCEFCGQKFEGKPKQRSVEYQEHQKSLGECSMILPEIYEGMTGLQWSRIEALKRQPKSATSDGKPPLSVRRWNEIWNILFPGETAPSPYFKSGLSQSEEKESTLDIETNEFRTCFNHISNNSNGEISPEDKAVQAFELWYLKWHAKQDVLQQTQQRSSQSVLQENIGFQAADSLAQKATYDPPMESLNTSSSQGGYEVAGNTQVTDLQEAPSVGEDMQSIALPHRRRVASAPSPRPASMLQPFQRQDAVEAYFEQRQPQPQPQQQERSTKQPEQYDSRIPFGSFAPQNFPPPSYVGLPLSNHNAPFTEYDVPPQGDSNSFNRVQGSSTNIPSRVFRMTEVLPTQASYYPPPAPQQFPAYGIPNLSRQLSSADTTNIQVATHQPVYSQPGFVNYAAPHPENNNRQDTTGYYDPNTGGNLYDP